MSGITGDVASCIELAFAEDLKDWLTKNKGIEISVNDIDEFVDMRFDGENMK